jgi:hypothetical protein
VTGSQSTRFDHTSVIASRSSPENLVGWLFCAIGLSFGVIHFSAEYAIYTLQAQPETLIAGEAAAWILSWGWVLAVGLIVFLALLFPDGRLPSRRWRWFAWLSLLLIFTGAVWGAFTPGAILRACYALGRKSHRNADSTIGLVTSRSPFPAFLSHF